ncbi:TrmH family RNA methyltransferase [Heliophilum fasciatum]|uniref:TrmH family RNA methyltransferase n=1 Tax=Heliophilum fasciatum TaxID=35700 RepID=A0A4R2S0X2_9FIRM|nr:RNA methyltransferase [Heliophilum fasciatum]MCW2276762.1 TrmH family RNA methyltransferase [Heliophilum fasciatum]TCP68857.1 TrmH family RNA methyltransferase [Heliophilum fasciatum]
MPTYREEPATVITSVQNIRVQRAKDLNRKKGRVLAGQFLLEGVRLVEEALASGIPLHEGFYSERLLNSERGQQLYRQLRTGGVDMVLVTDRVLQAISETEQCQGIVMIADLPRYQWQEVCQKAGEKAAALLLIIDGVQDPGNLGTMLRTAEAAGVQAVLLTAGTVDPFNPKVIRAAMGSVFRLPLASAPSSDELRQVLADQGMAVFVADAHGERRYDQADWTVPKMALVVGSEARGPEPLWLEGASEIVRIPLCAPVESLNAAIASALLLFEAAKQRRT